MNLGMYSSWMGNWHEFERRPWLPKELRMLDDAIDTELHSGFMFLWASRYSDADRELDRSIELIIDEP